MHIEEKMVRRQATVVEIEKKDKTIHKLMKDLEKGGISAKQFIVPMISTPTNQVYRTTQKRALNTIKPPPIGIRKHRSPVMKDQSPLQTAINLVRKPAKKAVKQVRIDL